ncbi:DNA repair protein RecN [Chloroflexota bacterium]
MLFELSVRDFGIIEEVTWKPAEGLNVISGETGAGKSLVVDAVEALLSGQAQEEDIRHGSESAQIEGSFRIPDNGVSEQMQNLLTEKGLEIEDNTLLFNCSFHRQSRTIPRINRQTIPRSLLQSIGSFLVDIHGQSGHLSLLDKENHLDFLDGYAHTRDLKRDFSIKVNELNRVKHEIDELLSLEQDAIRQKELLEFQIDEIREAELKKGEDDELEAEISILTSVEKLRTAAYEIYMKIRGDDSMPDASSVMFRLNEALPLLKTMFATDPSLHTNLTQLNDIIQGLTDLASDVRSYGDTLEFEPARLEEVQTRLEFIKSLKRKYGSSITEILDYLTGAEKQMEDSLQSDVRRQELETEIELLKREMGSIAAYLSGERAQAAKKLETAIKKELSDLDMSQVDFKVSISRQQSPKGIPLSDGELYQFTASGIDSVEFITSTNPGEPLKPLARIASTGEISRFMLALKCALAEADIIPVLIFDEIDIGIGGRSGEIVGRKLYNLSKNHQVICVTHLPQIAAFADAHYSVTKESAGDRTTSRITALQGNECLGELAEMIGGPDFTDSSLDAARELIQKADDWKKRTAQQQM